MKAPVKVTLIGGGGLRTPLLIHGLAQAKAVIGIRRLVLYDVDAHRATLMAQLGQAIIGDAGIRISATCNLEEAVEGADFVISSIRVGGMDARAHDERIAIEHGFAGQETTGPGGLAMALRTIPVALEQARVIERHADKAWLINFTNPAGLITQALMDHSNLRVIGICDTPSELFHRIAWALGEPFDHLDFRYFGLNHLGWVAGVLRQGEDVMRTLLADNVLLSKLYPVDLFDPQLLRTLALIPTEYLFFYYSQERAYRNQQIAGASRAEEILRLNTSLMRGLADDLAAGEPLEAIERYKRYLNQRNGSYMRLEGAGESAFSEPPHEWNPFEGETGYHRIAIDVMTALTEKDPRRIVVNVRNSNAVHDLEPDDVIETSCLVDRAGAKPLPVGRLPEAARGLVVAVKQFERLAIRAAVEKSFNVARLALLANPIVNDWDKASKTLRALVASDLHHLGYLK